VGGVARRVLDEVEAECRFHTLRANFDDPAAE
jgi:hypothetical protein